MFTKLGIATLALALTVGSAFAADRRGNEGAHGHSGNGFYGQVQRDDVRVIGARGFRNPIVHTEDHVVYDNIAIRDCHGVTVLPEGFGRGFDRNRDRHDHRR